MTDDRERVEPPVEPETRESLVQLLGGGKAAIEASIPLVAFLLGWLASAQSLWWASGAAIVASVGVAIWGLATGRRPRAVVIGLLAVVIAALIAARTGNAEDFFLIRLLSNAASALAWAGSIVVRWPLLGVIVGLVVGTKTTWRKDPVLLRAYGRASWIWVLQYVIRLLAFVPLYLAGEAGWLGFAQVVLTYPLVIAVLVVSGAVLFASIPKGHPGIRHPQVAP